nr:histone-like nucleoid-structuring protein Lsr2 [Streptomyces katsurahamanus]
MTPLSATVPWTGRTTAYRPDVPRRPHADLITAQIREWAKVNGYDVNDRGRVPATVREAYEKANS